MSAFRAKASSPLRAFALLRAIVDDERFAKLGAPAQAALLFAVIRYADHNGRWFAKQATIGAGLGRSDRRVRGALAACGGLLAVKACRRPDGTQTANEYALDSALVQQADESVRLWVGSRTETSGGTSPDGNVRPTRPDENVRPTVLNGLSTAVRDARSDDGRRERWLLTIGVEYAHDADDFREEACRALGVGAVEAEELRLELQTRGAA